MRILFLYIFLLKSIFVFGVASHDFSAILDHIRSETLADKQASAAFEVINRTIPNHAHLFNITVDLNLPTHTFLIEKNETCPIVSIVASSGVIACKGFYHYIKYYCNCHISWDGSQLSMPDVLPNVNIIDHSPSRFIYYQNVCTWSYSFVWWTWRQWQSHIDWMAMNGITLTLAPVQEREWMLIYRELGLTDDEIFEHFSGPAFSSWTRMGNMRGWLGSKSDIYIQKSAVLQRKIIETLRNLGIAVALPAFAGHVPIAFQRIFPNTTMIHADKWNNFPRKYCCPLFIEPNDPLFRKIGQLFLSQVIDSYGGTNHIYFSDPFNEMKPKLENANYFSEISAGIYNTMLSVDENAVWLLQGWMFVQHQDWGNNLIKAFLNAVPQGRILVLDLQSDHSPQYKRTNSYYGQPFIWCMLHNFGGTLGMHGSIDVINKEIRKARKMSNSTMVGVGITPEGIFQNYAMYEFALERGWDQITVDKERWFKQYAIARYGSRSPHLARAWVNLVNSVYAYNKTTRIDGQYIVCRRPSLRLTDVATLKWYNNSVLLDVIVDFMNPAYNFTSNNLFSHDLVDISRQILQNLIDDLYVKIVEAYNNKNIRELTRVSHNFKNTLMEMDRILGSHRDFLLGNWLEMAKEVGQDLNETRLYEQQARNQITLWGPDGQIIDYAMKQWSGIINDYCLPRWRKFFANLMSCLKTNRTFNENLFIRKVFSEVEEPFTRDSKIYPTMAHGNIFEIIKELYVKWV